jgi:hypothetical protein
MQGEPVGWARLAAGCVALQGAGCSMRCS